MQIMGDRSRRVSPCTYMFIPVRANSMTIIQHLSDKLRVLFGTLTDHKERCFCLMHPQEIQKLRRGLRIGTVVERQENGALIFYPYDTPKRCRKSRNVGVDRGEDLEQSGRS